MLEAASDAAARFEGMFLTPKQANALLAEPRFNIYDNPEAFLTCNNDPAKALCHPDRTSPGGSRDRPPAIDRCDPACGNIARTDSHIQSLQAEITQLTEEIASSLTPIPLRGRLSACRRHLQGIADRHQKTRIARSDTGNEVDRR
ncbi:hypothetical protein [Actinomadura sp. HBU206391]|uniref:hypothetical protein n=1 Tax=Actinomadura sp. HBU206391 TaxID=2731692 RepID=UPI00164EF906|nr:hypothetical protein [Actinomadura sp. HBU206391]MBC6458284.1 hypothetical protein [Actinomadura sp. HBU206391]